MILRILQLLFIFCFVVQSMCNSFQFNNAPELTAYEDEFLLAPWVRNITASSTCENNEKYCLWTTTGLHEGLHCGICDHSLHTINKAIDGKGPWWKSKNGEKAVTIDIEFGQEFFVTAIILKMGPTPAPSEWILERSNDSGMTYHPWQYFTNGRRHMCQFRFNITPNEIISRADQVLCKSSRVKDIENEEIVVNILRGRPGAKNFKTDVALQNWIRATNIRIIFLNFAWLHKATIEDISKKQLHFYTVQSIIIYGRCVCYGNHRECKYNKTLNQMTCLCDDNTCGTKCNKCCPGFNQRPWKPLSIGEPNKCEACNCFNHAKDCYYNSTVDEMNLSLDAEGRRSGGGVCINCQDNTEGINCEKCRDGFYRPAYKLQTDKDACQACNCNSIGSSSMVCKKIGGQCSCINELFGGRRCDQCIPEHWGFPNCQACDCFLAGSYGKTCNKITGQCICKGNAIGLKCDTCITSDKHLMTISGCLECDPCSLVLYQELQQSHHPEVSHWQTALSTPKPFATWGHIRLNWLSEFCQDLASGWIQQYRNYTLTKGHSISRSQEEKAFLEEPKKLKDLLLQIRNLSDILADQQRDLNNYVFGRIGPSIFVAEKIIRDASNLWTHIVDHLNASVKESIGIFEQVSYSSNKDLSIDIDSSQNSAEKLLQNIKGFFDEIDVILSSLSSLEKPPQLSESLSSVMYNYEKSLLLRRRVNNILLKMKDISWYATMANATISMMQLPNLPDVRSSQIKCNELKMKWQILKNSLQNDYWILMELSLHEQVAMLKSAIAVLEVTLGERLDKSEIAKQYADFLLQKAENITSLFSYEQLPSEEYVRRTFINVIETIESAKSIVHTALATVQKTNETLTELPQLLKPDFGEEFYAVSSLVLIETSSALAPEVVEMDNNEENLDSSGLSNSDDEDDDDDYQSDFHFADSIITDQLFLDKKINGMTQELLISTHNGEDGHYSGLTKDAVKNANSYISRIKVLVGYLETRCKASSNLYMKSVHDLSNINTVLKLIKQDTSETWTITNELYRRSLNLTAVKSNVNSAIAGTVQKLNSLRLNVIEELPELMRQFSTPKTNECLESVDKATAIIMKVRPTIGRLYNKYLNFNRGTLLQSKIEELRKDILVSKKTIHKFQVPLSFSSPGFVSLGVPNSYIPEYSHVTNLQVWFNSKYNSGFIARLGNSSKSEGCSMFLYLNSSRIMIMITQDENKWLGQHSIPILKHMWFHIEVEWVWNNLTLTVTPTEGIPVILEHVFSWKSQLKRFFIPLLWLGGVPEEIELMVNGPSDFDGCLSGLKVNGNSMGMLASVSSRGIQSKCHSQINAPRKIAKPSLFFDGHHIFEVIPLQNEVTFFPSLRFSFKTLQRDAAILLIMSENKNEWVVVKLNAGKLVVEVGSRQKTKMSTSSVLSYNDGNSHLVNVNVSGKQNLRQVDLNVDSSDRSSGSTYIAINHQKSTIFAGGIPHNLNKANSMLPMISINNGILSCYEGCLHELSVNNRSASVESSEEEFIAKSTCPNKIGRCACVSKESPFPIHVKLQSQSIKILGLSFSVNKQYDESKRIILFYSPSPYSEIQLQLLKGEIWLEWKVTSTLEMHVETGRKALISLENTSTTWHTFVLENNHNISNRSVIFLDNSTVELPNNFFTGLRFEAQHRLYLGGMPTCMQLFDICFNNLLVTDKILDFSTYVIPNTLTTCHQA